MIIRVLHEGQYELDGQLLERVNELDEQIFKAVVDGEDERYGRLLNQTLQVIRDQGRPLAVDDLRASDLVLPAPDSTLAEVRALFQQEGLIPN